MSDADGMALVVDAAMTRGMKFHMLFPTGMQRMPVPFKEDCGSFYLVGDDRGPDPERDSVGPKAFDGELLTAALRGATTVVTSAVMPPNAGALVAAMLSVTARDRIVVVVTHPHHHAAWAAKVLELSGRVPVLHVVPEGADLGQFGASGETVH